MKQTKHSKLFYFQWWVWK